MTTDELLATLMRERPNGVSFEPMAVRLLRQKVPFEDWQAEDLKSAMFQIEGGLWFSREMIGDDASLVPFKKQATDWLKEYGCFSVERLHEDSCGLLRHITTPEACAAFLRHLGFSVETWRTGCHFCTRPSCRLDDALAAISEMIDGGLEKTGGILSIGVEF